MIGFIGTGIMGAFMAQNLLDAGNEMIVFDVRPEATRDLVKAGAKLAERPSEMAECEAVFIMVNTLAQVQDVVMKKSYGIAPAFKGRKPLRLVIMSTVPPTGIQSLADLLKDKCIEIIDAPVSGGPIRAKEGNLSVMIGGDEKSVYAVKPYLDAMGQNIFHIGPLGSGSAMKLVNNILTLSSLYIVPEALRLGLKGGLELKTMLEVIRESTGNNWHFDHWRTYVGFLNMLLEDPRHHDSLKQISVKDVQSALEWAEEMEYDTPVLKSVLSLIKVGQSSTGMITEDLFKRMKECEDY